MNNTHEWCSEATTPQIHNLQGLDVALFPWWMERLRQDKNIVIPDVAQLPPEAGHEKEILEMQDIRSLLVVPLYCAGRPHGFLGLDDVKGTRMWLDEDVRLLRTAGEIIARGIERARAEEYMLRTERLAAMGRLAAALAHEINNPLQAISNNLELALDFPLEEEEREKYLGVARGEIERLTALTNHVLYFARPTRVERQPITVAKAVHDALGLASRQLDHSDIRVSVDLLDVVPPVMASSSQLAQVFLNLIINAIEAMPDGGELSIVARLAGDQLKVTFTDSGPGIPPDAMAKLFEPFYTTKENGTAWA